MHRRNALTSTCIRLALDAGYTYDRKTGNVYGKHGKLLKGTFLRLFINGYSDPNKGIKIMRHYFIAYMKFGEQAFEQHPYFIDGNNKNLDPNNIGLTRDAPWRRSGHSPEMRKDIAENFHKDWGGGGVKRLAKKWGVTSPTVRRIYERHLDGKAY